MVVIINGEIVQDNDPRAVARRSKMSGGSTTTTTTTTNNRRTSGRGTIGGLSGLGGGSSEQSEQQNVAAAAAAARGGGDPDGPLGQLARMIGVQGRFFTIPPVSTLGTTEQKIPLIEMLIAGLFVAFFGKTGAAIVLLYLVTMRFA